MKILRIIGVIIEIIIAIAIFIILAQKTPLFERILGTSETTIDSSTGSTVEKKKSLINSGYKTITDFTKTVYVVFY